MPRPRGADWVAVVFLALSIPLVFVQWAGGLLLVVLWLATVGLFVTTRLELPRFVPRPTRAPGVQNLDVKRMEAVVGPVPAYALLLPGVLTTTIAPAALISPEGGVPIFGFTCVLALSGGLAVAIRHEQVNARVVRRVLAAKSTQRLIGTVRSMAGPVKRVLSIYMWMAYREEVEHGFRVATGEGMVEVQADAMVWAARSREVEAKPPSVRTRGPAEKYILMSLPLIGARLEAIEEGDRILLLKPVGHRPFQPVRGTAEDPIVVYAVGHDEDPIASLRAARRVRGMGIAVMGLCLVTALVVLVAS